MSSQDDAMRKVTEAAMASAVNNPFIAWHVMMQQMMSAGFSEDQACKIIATMAAQLVQGGGTPDA